MDVDTLKKQISDYSDISLEKQSHGYSPAAEAYNKARPKYPDALIQQVVNIAQLSSSPRILEVMLNKGCCGCFKDCSDGAGFEVAALGQGFIYDNQCLDVESQWWPPRPFDSHSSSD